METGNREFVSHKAYIKVNSKNLELEQRYLSLLSVSFIDFEQVFSHREPALNILTRLSVYWPKAKYILVNRKNLMFD